MTLDHQELSFSDHVNLVTLSCYYQLRQLRVVMRSLSHEAAVVLVHAFFASRIDHCCISRCWSPVGFNRHLGRVLRSAARLIGHILKYASVSAYMRDVLHWLLVSQRILYRITALVYFVHCGDLYSASSRLLLRSSMPSRLCPILLD